MDRVTSAAPDSTLSAKSPGLFSFLITFVISIGLVFAGYVFGMSTWNDLRDRSESVHWPTTTGKLLSASIVQDSGQNQLDSTNPSYSILFTYQYQVADQTYTATKVSFLRYGTQSQARAFANAQVPGSSIAVYYAPQDPSRTQLIPGGDKFVSDQDLYPVLGLSGGLAGCGALLLLSVVVTAIMRILPHRQVAS